MEEIATVVETKGNKAWVKIVRHSACSKCEKKCGLNESHEQDELVVEIENKAGWEEGQQVVLKMQERSMVFASLIVYLLPMLAMIIGYFVGNWFAVKWGFQSTEVVGIIGTITFLLLSFLVIKIIDRLMGRSSNFKPVIKRINR